MLLCLALSQALIVQIYPYSVVNALEPVVYSYWFLVIVKVYSRKDGGYLIIDSISM